MKNNFIIKINYTSNFNPIFYKNFTKIKNKNKNKIFCRNLFLFLFLIKYSNFFFKNSITTVFIKPFNKNITNILRAPYKNKLSKNQISFNRYNIVFKLKINFIKINFKNFNQFFNFFKNMFLYFNFFETNFLKNDKFIFFIKFKFYNFFNLKLFN